MGRSLQCDRNANGNAFRSLDIIDTYPEDPCENKKCGEQCAVKGETKEIKPGVIQYLIKHGLCNDDGSCKAADTVKCFLDKESHVYRSLDETKKLCFNHTELCNDEEWQGEGWYRFKNGE